MNRHIRKVIIAPMTTKGRDYPTRISCTFKAKKGQIVLDQIRTVDKTRLVTLQGKRELYFAQGALLEMAKKRLTDQQLLK